MIKNKPTKKSDRTDLLRNAIEHRATWAALLIDEAKKRGLDTSFAHEAIRRCGVFHGLNKYPRTDDLSEFAPAFANQDVIDVFEMEIMESSDERLHIDFHYCPLVSAWLKLGLPEDDIPELCEIAMDGDRGIISTYPEFAFKLGKTIAKGDDVCEIRIDKVKK
jgi:hypothetical protein